MIGSVAPPLPNGDAKNQQQLKNQLALQTILHNPSIKTVAWVVALRGIFPLDEKTGFISNNQLSGETIAAYSLAIQQLEKAGKRVVFVIDNPTFPDPRSCISGGRRPPVNS